MSPSRKRRAKSLSIRKWFGCGVNGGFFDRRRNPLPASDGSLIIKLLKWFRGVRLESAQNKEHNHLELSIAGTVLGQAERE
jgi:hypothetical protein